MRRMVLAAVCAIGMATTAIPGRAQVSVHINISSQPLWGPVGYDYVEYYYLPDLEMYYYVPAHKFVYINGGRWIFSSTLPVWYQDYDLYTIHKVVINEPKPYRHFHVHKVKYAPYKGGPHKQVFIRNSNNPKYYIVKGHPRYHVRSTPKPIRHDKRNGYTRSAKPQPQEKQYRIRDNQKSPAPGGKRQGGKQGHGGGNKGGKGKGH